jgi:hypothetical protein
VLHDLSRHKADIVVLLRPGRNSRSAEEWRAFFDERAGIAEFEGGLSRAVAEAHAFTCCVTEWMNYHPMRSLPGHCYGCGAIEQAGEPLLPFGTEDTGHAWLHSRCWPDWLTLQRTKAEAALRAMGIARSAELVDGSGKGSCESGNPGGRARLPTDVKEAFQAKAPEACLWVYLDGSAYVVASSLR